ncbi:MAG: LacI family DNA-binding transcriptional regulator [Spirochaetales bacterium]|nr:LacI family DNA-binding transcriptional regulator [Spirochaetales bacterium]
MNPQSIPKRDDVAEEAGVSSATVSRVYNNPDSVSPEKKNAVLKAAQKLGYVPNKAASALRRNGSGTITLVEFKKKKREYYWADLPLFKWFYAEVLHSVKDIIDESMFHLNLATINTKEDMLKLQGQTDGLICYDVDMTEEAEMIADSPIPYVIGHHTKDFSPHPRCCTDNTEGGRLQAELLKKAGCEKPVYITGFTQSVAPNRERLEGFISVYGDSIRIIETNIGREAGFKTAGNLIKDIKNGKIDGIAAVNDITAAGAGYALEASGINIQTDIPLAGYDNMPFGDFLPFRLMSVNLRPAEIYQEAAKMLLEKIQGNTKTGNSKIILPKAIGQI